MSGFQPENIIFLAHFKNKNRFPEFPWKMASEQHCVTIHKLLYWQGKKRKLFFFSFCVLYLVCSLHSAFCTRGQDIEGFFVEKWALDPRGFVLIGKLSLP